jgi:hypothetical protein
MLNRLTRSTVTTSRLIASGGAVLLPIAIVEPVHQSTRSEWTRIEPVC